MRKNTRLCEHVEASNARRPATIAQKCSRSAPVFWNVRRTARLDQRESSLCASSSPSPNSLFCMQQRMRRCFQKQSTNQLCCAASHTSHLVLNQQPLQCSLPKQSKSSHTKVSLDRLAFAGTDLHLDPPDHSLFSLFDGFGESPLPRNQRATKSQ